MAKCQTIIAFQERQMKETLVTAQTVPYDSLLLDNCRIEVSGFDTAKTKREWCQTKEPGAPEFGACLPLCLSTGVYYSD